MPATPRIILLTAARLFCVVCCCVDVVMSCCCRCYAIVRSYCVAAVIQILDISFLNCKTIIVKLL